jgi:hypothetical protein
MKNLKYLLLLALLVTSAGVFYSCETADPITSVNQDRIYQMYEVEYRGDEAYTYGRATFRLESASGSYVTLTGGNAGVTFNGSNMSEVSLFGVVFYQAGSNGPPPPNCLFVYTDAGSTSFSNNVNISSQTISFISPPTTISRSTGQTFGFTGSISSGETVWLRIYKTSDDSLVFERNNISAGSNTIVMSASDFNAIPEGSYYAKLYRNDQQPIQQANPVGGIISRSYISTRASFTLVP